MTDAQMDELRREVDMDSPCAWDLPGLRRELLTAIEDAEARGFQAGQEAMRERIVDAARRTLSKDDNVHEWTKYARRIIDAAQALPVVAK